MGLSRSRSMPKIIPRKNLFYSWSAAIRYQTLMVVAAPVIIGFAIAYGDGLSHGPSALMALLGALFIQAGTNLANDHYDLKNGVDTEAHVGPVSALRAGLVSRFEVKVGFYICFALAAVCGVLLTMRAGWPVMVIAVASIMSGILYSAGKRPLAALGLGDLWVFVFFGPVAVVGTYFVQTFEWNTAVILAGCGVGFWSMAIIDINNLRDADTDARAGRKTLSVRFGKAFARMEYLFCLLAASVIPVVIYLLTGAHCWIMASSFVVFLCIPLIHLVFTKDDKALNNALALTSLALFLYAIIFSIGWLW